MTEPTKSSVYRQLYHTANGLENRFTRPSTSRASTIEEGASPLLSGRAMAAAVALGVTVLGVYAAIKALGDGDKSTEQQADIDEAKAIEEAEVIEDPGLVEAEEETEEAGAEVEEAEAETKEPEPELVAVDEGSGFWNKTMRLFGLNRESPQPAQEELPQPSTKTIPAEPVTTAKDPAKTSQAEKTPAPSKPETSAIYISRGTPLGSVRLLTEKQKKTIVHPERGRVADPSFVGKYSRLNNVMFSPAELSWARRLVKVGAPINGRMGKSFLPIVRAAIMARAKAYGLDPQAMVEVASMESGGDPNAVSGTGAIGIYQFTVGSAKLFNLRNRFDMDANIEAGMLLTVDNNKRLPPEARGPLGSYIAHQIGISSAKEVLTSPKERQINTLRSATRRNISHNVGRNARTVGGYLSANQNKMKETYQGQMAAAPFKGTLKITQYETPTQGVRAATKVSDLSVETEGSESPTPMTAVISQKPATPDMSFSPKADAIAPIESPPQEEKVAQNQSSPRTTDRSASSESENKTTEMFRLGKDGPLVVI